MKQKLISLASLIVILAALVFPSFSAQAASRTPAPVKAAPTINPDGSTTYDDTEPMFQWHNGSTTIQSANIMAGWGDYYGGTAQTTTGANINTSPAFGDVTINYHGGDFYLMGGAVNDSVNGHWGSWLVKLDGINVPYFNEFTPGDPRTIKVLKSETYKAPVGDHVVQLYCTSVCMLDGITIYPTSSGLIEKGIWIDDSNSSILPYGGPGGTLTNGSDPNAYMTTITSASGGRGLTFTYFGGDIRLVGNTNNTNGGWQVWDASITGSPIGQFTMLSDVSLNQTISPTIHVGAVGWHTITIKSISSIVGDHVNLDAIIILGITDCSTQYVATPPQDLNLPINPTVEAPAGFSNDPTPPDVQKQHTVIGQYYMFQVKGGPWNDGAGNATRYDTAVSWDGQNYTPLKNLTTLCFQVDPFHPDLEKVFIQAVSDTFYIRVNDTSGNFANNTVVGALTYDFSWAWNIGSAPPPCTSSFSYDRQANWVASISLNSTSPDTPVGTSLIPGDYYAVEVASGGWQEGASPSTTRYDMQFAFEQPSAALIEQPSAALNWVQMVTGIPGVQCGTADGRLMFIQAGSDLLHLRVNDQNNNFADNTGHLGVNIYHATYTPPIAACEATFSTQSLIWSGSVDANQQNGVVAGISWGPTNNPNQPPNSFLPGAWYVLETTGGPWKIADNVPGGISYELAISTDGSSWMPLKTWNLSPCIVPIDALGHIKVYFQVPTTGPATFTLRVNETGSWSNNSGSMGWNIYAATDMQIPPPQGTCDYVYAAGQRLSGGVVDAKAQYGSPVDQGTAQAPMIIGQYYAIVIRNDKWQWHESSGSPPLTAMQISDDTQFSGGGGAPGGHWYDLPNGYGRLLCTYMNGVNPVYIIKYIGNTFLRVASTTFSDNTGFMEWDVYPASPGDSINPWTVCFAGSTPNLINSGAWIPVTDENGTYINGTAIQGALQVAETYMVQTQNGPWRANDGGLFDGNRRDVALSSDGGATWHQIDKNFTDITCAKQDQMKQYWKIYFTVKSGQQWKIRVNDKAGQFGDNSGNMGYALYALTGAGVPPMPQGPPVTTGGPGACDVPLIRPTSILDIPAWIDYWGTAFQQFLIWCPRNTDSILTASDSFTQREPFATIAEMKQSIMDVQTQLNSYNWSDPNAPQSIITSKSPTSFDLFPSAGSNPWNGGQLINFHGADITSAPFYSTCMSEMGTTMGSVNLARGVCWGSAWMRETGASFLIQLTFDVMMATVLVQHIWKTSQMMMNLLTGGFYGFLGK